MILGPRVFKDWKFLRKRKASVVVKTYGYPLLNIYLTHSIGAKNRNEQSKIYYMSKKITLLILSLLVITACKKTNDRKAQAERIVAEWVGKTVYLSDDIPLVVFSKDTLIPNFKDTPYKILLYVDSMGCTSCKLKIYEWQKLIAEVDSAMHGQVSFLFYFQPKSREELIYLFRRDRFNYPVFIDNKNMLNNDNHLPNDPTYQCFLLDGNNKVLMVGNPARNPQIWELYKQIITGKQADTNIANTKVVVDSEVVELKDISREKKRKVAFKLKNTGENSLVITNIKTSCGCTTADWEKAPVEPGATTAISAEINIKEQGFFQKTVSLYCNATNSPIVFTIKGNTK